MSNPKTTVYGIPNCDTVKRARTWLTEHDIAYEFHDYKKQGVPETRLAAWSRKLGWEPLVNRKGTTWRKLDPAEQAGVQDAASAQALMLTNPSVIKRPVVEWADGSLTAGFDPDQWQERL